MPFDQERSQIAFERLSRQVEKLASKPLPENVHKFRTSGRRVEALLCQLVPEPNRNYRRLLRMLARLRKKAGRVRDLDVQIAAVRSLKIPSEPGRKSQLTRMLAEERLKRERKLRKAFDKETMRRLRKRLKRAARELEIPPGTEPLAVALRQMAQLGRGHGPLTEETLHQYRIAGKRARYLAELAGNDTQAERLVEQLKRMQDVIGDWHDWLKLTGKAEALFGTAQDSALVAALRNVTGAKFRQAAGILEETRAALAARKSAPIAPGRKQPGQSGSRAATAAA